MKKSKYFDDMLVSESQLNYTEQTKEEAILERMQSGIQPGIFVGLNISQITNTQIKVNPGIGFTASGERIEVKSGEEPTMNFTPADANKTYFIILRYQEADIPGSEAPLFGGGYSSSTQRRDFFVIEKNETYPTGVINPEKTIPVGIVSLDASGQIINIINLENLTSKFSIDQPLSVTGVFINSLSGLSSIPENGLKSNLKFEISGGVRRLSWKADVNASYGPAVDITQNGLYNIYSGAPYSSVYIIVYVDVVSLPTTNLDEDLFIFDLYDRLTKRFPRFFSYTDKLHRLMLGSGMPNEKNPHGLTIEDIGGIQRIVDEMVKHRDLHHANGIVSPTRNALQVGIQNPSSPPIINIAAPAQNEFYYVDGVQRQVINNTTLQIDTTDNPPYLNSEGQLAEIYVDKFGDIKMNVIAVSRSGNPVPINGIDLVDVDDGWDNGPGNQRLEFAINANLKQIRLTYTGINGAWTTITADGYYEVISPINAKKITVYVQPNLLVTNAVWDWQALPRVNKEESLILANVWTKKVSGVPTIIQIYDKRLFGTISKDELRDDVFEFSKSFHNRLIQEIRGNGVIYGLGIFQASPTTISREAGVCLVGGKRFELARADYNIPSDGTWYVYIDQNGNTIISQLGPGLPNNARTPALDFVQLARVTRSGGNITSIVDVREGVGLISHRERAQWGLPFKMPVSLTLIDASQILGEDKCQAKWGDGVNGYFRIICVRSAGATGRTIWYFTQNLRWDGTNWYKDVPHRASFRKAFYTYGTDEILYKGGVAEEVWFVRADEYVNPPYGPVIFDSTNNSGWFIQLAPDPPNHVNFIGKKGIDRSTNIDLVNFYNYDAGSFMDIAVRNLIIQGGLRLKYLGAGAGYSGSINPNSAIVVIPVIPIKGPFVFPVLTFDQTHSPNIMISLTYYYFPFLYDGYVFILKNHADSTQDYNFNFRLFRFDVF